MASPAPPKHTAPHDLEDHIKGKTVDLDKIVDSYNNYASEENMNHYFNREFMPAMDKMYKSIETELDKVFAKDTDLVHGKLEDIQKAYLAGLKTWFTEKDKKVLDRLTPGMSVQEQYQILAMEFDMRHGHDPRNQRSPTFMQGRAESMAGNKKVTKGHILRNEKMQATDIAESAFGHLLTKKKEHLVAGTTRDQWHEYSKKALPKYNHVIDDPITFYRKTEDEFLDLHRGLKHDKWAYNRQTRKDFTSSDYGLAKKK